MGSLVLGFSRVGKPDISVGISIRWELVCVDLKGTPHGLRLFGFGTITYLCFAYTVDFRRGQQQVESPSSRLTQS